MEWHFLHDGTSKLTIKMYLRPPGGGGGTRLIFGYRWAAEGLKPWLCLVQKIPKIRTLFRTTPSILVPCLGQLHTNTKSNVHETPCLTNYAHWLGQTCAKLFTPFRTWDREDENRTLSSGTSPYRAYKEDPLPLQPGPLTRSILTSYWVWGG